MAEPPEKSIYTLVPLEDGKHGVRVSTPGRFPPEFHVFASRDHAEAWIDGHRRGSERSN